MKKNNFFKLCTFFTLKPDIYSNGSEQCDPSFLKRGLTSKRINTFKIAVLAIRGNDSAYEEFNSTFSEYLTLAVGNHFDHPVKFEMIPTSFNDLFEETKISKFDFIYVNPSAYSCIESEFGARSLASQISRRSIGGKIYHLTEFGGVIFSLKNSTIETLQDIKGKITAAASVSGLGSGQMQARELIIAGISYMNDPKQVVYTSDQSKVVMGVLSKDFDVGFVRTDQLERTLINGKPVDTRLFKVIDPKIGLNVDGVPFPFQSSTPLYPEWNVAALNHVSNDVSRAVQEALYKLESYAIVGEKLDECYIQRNCTSNMKCYEVCNEEVTLYHSYCSKSIEIALLAHRSRSQGKYTGWRSTLSYMQLRNMQKATGFIKMDTNYGLMKCLRSNRLYDAISCPVGYIKKTEEEVLRGCEDAGLPCREGFQCLCKPCSKGYDVNLFPYGSSEPCEKFSECGKVEQMQTLSFTAIDSKKRENITMNIHVYNDEEDLHIIATPILEQSYSYRFSISLVTAGSMIMEIKVDNKQISQSPFRVIILPKNCTTNFQTSLRIPTKSGQCVCHHTSSEIGKFCISNTTLFLGIFCGITITCLVMIAIFAKRNARAYDSSVWEVKVKDIHISEPPVILGRGSFGLVILGEFRGTPVALKKVIPPKPVPTQKRIKTSNGLGNISVAGRGSVTKEASTSIKKIASLKTMLSAIDQELETGKIRARPEGRVSGLFNFKKEPGRDSTASLSDSSSRKISRLSLLSSSSELLARDEYTKLKSDFIAEMRIISKLRHPRITTVMGAVVSKSQDPLLVMELMEMGSLYDLLHNETVAFDHFLNLSILKDITLGLCFLHAALPIVVHGDLKAQNVLIDSKLRAKVSDFGLSQKKKVGVSGSPYWMSPELLRGESGNTAASDVFSFGILIYEIFSRKEPYENENFEEVLKLVSDPVTQKRPPMPVSSPEEMQILTKECLHDNASKRPTFKEIEKRLARYDEEKNSFPFEHKKGDTLKKVISSSRYSNFPKHIAEAIISGKKIEPESFPEVTICFSNIVDFSTLSTIITDANISTLLDRLYRKFDEILDKYDIFKVETVGESYMCAANLIQSQPDHVKRISIFATEIIEAANLTLIDEQRPSLGFVKIRVGFHSGPVVTNVVGSRNLKFSLFGDTVNVAARMESNSNSNRIHCSETSALLLKRYDPSFPLLMRGRIKIKGKGYMNTYWVNETQKQNQNFIGSSNSLLSHLSSD